MKFINKVIVFVMGVVVIGVVVTSIGVATQSKTLKKVTFEVLTLDEDEYVGTVTPGTYDKILSYVKMDDPDGGKVNNIVSILINDIETLSDNFYLIISYDSPISVQFYDHMEGDFDEILSDDQLAKSLGILTLNDVISITFEVEQETPVIIKTLLFLTPLILSASLIGFLAFRKGENL